jgi:hypothetical protein
VPALISIRSTSFLEALSLNRFDVEQAADFHFSGPIEKTTTAPT